MHADVGQGERGLDVLGRGAGVLHDLADDFPPCPQRDLGRPTAPGQGHHRAEALPLPQYSSDCGLRESYGFGNQFVAFSGLVSLDHLSADVFGNFFGARHRDAFSIPARTGSVQVHLLVFIVRVDKAGDPATVTAPRDSSNTQEAAPALWNSHEPLSRAGSCLQWTRRQNAKGVHSGCQLAACVAPEQTAMPWKKNQTE